MEYSYGERVITANGRYLAYRDSVDVNDSAIWTRLIQEAGRKCDDYASDLLIDYGSYKRDLPEFVKNKENHQWLFGFRPMGVDHTEFIERSDRKYFSLFNLNLIIEDDELGFFKLELRRVG